MHSDSIQYRILRKWSNLPNLKIETLNFSWRSLDFHTIHTIQNLYTSPIWWCRCRAYLELSPFRHYGQRQHPCQRNLTLFETFVTWHITLLTISSMLAIPRDFAILQFYCWLFWFRRGIIHLRTPHNHSAYVPFAWLPFCTFAYLSTQCDLTSYNVSFDNYISFFNSEIIILSIQKLLSRMRTVFQMLLSPNSRQRIIVDYLYKPGVVSIHYWCFLLHSYSPYQSLEGMLFKHSQSQYWLRMKIILQRVQ